MIETITFLLLLALFNALLINGLKKAFEFETYPVRAEEYVHETPGGFDREDSMILGHIHYTAKLWIGAKWCKPLFSCVACMASVHSTYIFWPVMLNIPFEPPLIWAYLAYVPVVSAFAMVVQNKIS